MDKISFKFVIEKEKFFNIEIFLNEEKMPHHVFNTMDSIAASQVDLVEFDLFTCTCGVSGCAGFNSPLHQSKTDKTVSWLFSEDYNTPKKLYTFNRKEFEDSFSTLVSQIKKYNEAKIYSMDSYEIMTDEVYEYDTNKQKYTFDEILAHSIERFKLKSKLLTICKEYIPFFTKVNFEYDGYKATVNASDLACMLINEWPRVGLDNKFYWGRVVLACNAVNELVLNKDTSNAEYLDFRSYADFYETKPKFIFNFIHRLSFQKTIDNESQTIYFEDETIFINGVESPYPENFSFNDFKIIY